MKSKDNLIPRNENYLQIKEMNFFYECNTLSMKSKDHYFSSCEIILKENLWNLNRKLSTSCALALEFVRKLKL